MTLPIQSTESATYTLQDKLAALQAAFNCGVLTQAEYAAKVNTLTNPTETFSWVKFLEGMISTLEPVNWAKDFASLFNIRKIIIYCLIGTAFWLGYHNRIPTFNLGPGSLQGKSFTLKLANGDSLVLNKSGVLKEVNSNGTTIETIRVKDLPALEKAINPIGLEFKPFLAGGMSMGTSGASGDVGIGAHVFHIYDCQTDGLVTNSGAYLGESYRLSKFMGGNTSVGIGAGPQWKGGVGALVYMSIDF
jgi:hypothetical protein